MKRIAPSILSADFGRLREEIQAVEAAGADYLHIDVMDGHFVPNITFGPVMVETARKISCLPLDVHLMIQNPDQYIPDFSRAGADVLAVQIEVCPHLNRTINLIRECSMIPAVVLNPSTPLVLLDQILEEVDMVMIMSVNPGFGGQKFIPQQRSENSKPEKNDHRTKPGGGHRSGWRGDPGQRGYSGQGRGRYIRGRIGRFSHSGL